MVSILHHISVFLLAFNVFASIFCLISGQSSFGLKKQVPAFHYFLDGLQFKEPVDALVHQLVRGTAKGRGLQWLEELVDDFGHRHLCSAQLEK